MKKFIAILVVTIFTSNIQAQVIKGLINKVTNKDNNAKSGLSTEEVVQGLKEALTVGAEKSANQLSNVDGFFKNEAIKILLPPEAKKVQDALSKIPGGSKYVEDAILSMNRAAEDAAKSAAPIFINAIKNMSFADAWEILKGSDSAATKYLKQQTSKPLTDAFRPIIDKSLAKVNATQHWNTVFSTYNKFSFKKINPDLASYVTEKALEGIFYQLAQEELKIRKDPIAQTTNLLKKVFGGK
ncbi:MAG TPA: DUF4197 domain-containing protein [Chitinophagaceae bacterium]|nr:DUF4197 domain-containing protein [Chitinophagaceae bacterium]HNF28748.1 DUF4197 domain-containing protein [Chitinophagaceae bacterium]